MVTSNCCFIGQLPLDHSVHAPHSDRENGWYLPWASQIPSRAMEPWKGQSNPHVCFPSLWLWVQNVHRYVKRCARVFLKPGLMSSIHQTSYCPFLPFLTSSSPFFSTGRRIAELEIHIALAQIIKTFEVSFPDNMPLGIKEELLNTPNRPMNLSFKDLWSYWLILIWCNVLLQALCNNTTFRLTKVQVPALFLPFVAW